jgi:hypothetical protein
MSAEDVLKAFEELIQNSHKLQNGKEFLDEFLSKVPNFGITACKIIISQEVDSHLRKLIGYIMKNVLKDHWMVNAAI